MTRSHRRHTAARSLPILALAMVLAAGSGCNVFDTRTPQTPDNVVPIEFESPLEPRIVLSNITRTLEAGSEINYDDSLTDDFVTTPSAEEAGCPALQQWDKTEEVNATRDWLSGVGPEDEVQLVVTFTPPGGDFDNLLDADDGPQGEVQRYYRDLAYALVFTSATEGTVTYSGLADLYFREDGALWSVYDFVDKSDGSDNFTWSRLRCNPQVEFER